MPAQPANQNAISHGATSERHIRPLAHNHRRRVLRQLRLSPRDLGPIARGYLDLYCRTQAKVELIDAFVSEHGLVRPDGEPQAVLKVYTSLVNSSRLALARLEAHLGTKSMGGDALYEYIGSLDDDA